MAGASGGVCALFTNLWYEERRTGEPKFVLQMAMNGALSGLVAVTSGCALVEPYGAIIIGVIAGWLYMLSSALLIKLRIDDAVNAIPVHMVNGCWGLIATGLLASPRMLELTYGAQHSNHPGLFYTFGSGNGPVDGNLLLCQIMAILFIFGWTFITMFPFFIWLNYKYVFYLFFSVPDSTFEQLHCSTLFTHDLSIIRFLFLCFAVVIRIYN